MCHMMYCPPRRTPLRRQLEAAAALHKDGYGHAVMTDYGWIISGKHDNAELLIDDFLYWRKQHPSGPALFHARHATNHNVDHAGMHPWMRPDGHVAVAPNGQMFPVPESDSRNETPTSA